MEIFKTYLFFSDYDQGHSYLIDTIQHEGQWWLVGSWIEAPATRERVPERLILLDGFHVRYEEVRRKEYRFSLQNSIPKAVLDGKEQGEYVVAVFPALAHIQGPKSTH